MRRGGYEGCLSGVEEGEERERGREREREREREKEWKTHSKKTRS